MSSRVRAGLQLIQPNGQCKPAERLDPNPDRNAHWPGPAQSIASHAWPAFRLFSGSFIRNAESPTYLMLLRVTKPYLPTFQPSKQATSRLVQTRIPAEKWREIIGQIQASARCIGRPKLCTQRKPAAETRAAGIPNF